MAEPNAPRSVTRGRIVSATGKMPVRPEPKRGPPPSVEAIPPPSIATPAPQPRLLSVAVGVTAIVCLLALTILGALWAFDRWRPGRGEGPVASSPDAEAKGAAPPLTGKAPAAAARATPVNEPERLAVMPNIVEPHRPGDVRQANDAPPRAAAVAAAAETQPPPAAGKPAPEPKERDPLERRPVERLFPETTKPPEKEKAPAGLPLGDFGTRISFEKSMAEAEKQAKDKNKLVLVLQLIGDFEKGRFSDARTDQFRREVLGDDAVVDYLSEHFALTLQKPPARGLGAKGPGVCYFCAADGGVLHIAIAPNGAAALLAEARWAVETRLAALEATTVNGKPDLARCRSLIHKTHLDRFRSEYDPEGFAADQTKELKREARKLGLPGAQNQNRFMGWWGKFVPFSPPPAPPKPKAIPESMPANISDRAKVHWLLQANTNAASLPPVSSIAPLVWEDILKAK